MDEDIIETDNKIQKENQYFRRRFVSLLIDTSLFAIIIIAFFEALYDGLIESLFGPDFAWAMFFVILISIVLIPIFVVFATLLLIPVVSIYKVITISIFSTTIGGYLAGVKVVGEQNEKVSFYRMLKREMLNFAVFFILFIVLLLGWPFVIAIVSGVLLFLKDINYTSKNDEGRLYRDVIAGTKVVRVK